MNDFLDDRLRKKAAAKFEPVFSNPDSVCPDSLVVEQASGIETSSYAASLLHPEDVTADLTAGLGINVFGFASVCVFVYAVELDENRARALEVNLRIAGCSNVEVINDDCLHWLRTTDKNFNVAFLDPARRSLTGKKMVRLEDCSPNVLEVIPLLKGKATRLLVKLSPLLDIKEVMRRIPGTSCINILEVNREVKELLVDVDLTAVGNTDPEMWPSLKGVLLNGRDKPLEIEIDTDVSIPADFASVEDIHSGGYVYEPSPAVMKAGMFSFKNLRFPNLLKFHENSHLFFSDTLYSGYPGRIFRVNGLLSSKDLKKMKGENFNVISRNHPAKAQELQDRFKFRSSDDNFIIASTIGKDKIILNTIKV